VEFQISTELHAHCRRILHAHLAVTMWQWWLR